MIRNSLRSKGIEVTKERKRNLLVPDLDHEVVIDPPPTTADLATTEALLVISTNPPESLRQI